MTIFSHFNLFSRALKLSEGIFINHQIFSRCSEKNLRWYYFILSPNNLQENAKTSSGAKIRTEKTRFSQYLTQLIQNMTLGHKCFILYSKNVTFKYYPASFSFFLILIVKNGQNHTEKQFWLALIPRTLSRRKSK